MRSIQWRIVAIHVLLIVLAMILVSVYLLGQWKSYYIETARQDLEGKGNLLRNQQLLNEDDLIGAAAVLGFAEDEGSNLVLLNQAMQAIVCYGPDIGITPGDNLLENQPVSELLSHPGDDGPFVQETYYRAGTYYLTMAIPASGEVEGQRVTAIFLLKPLTDVFNILSNIKVTLLRATLLALAVVTVLGLASARTITQPIVEITSQAEKLAAGNFDISVRVHSRDEVGRLAEVFNYLIGELRESLHGMANEKSKLEAILGNMSNGVVALDRSGRLIHINPKARGFLDLPETASAEDVLAGLKLGTSAEVLAAAPGVRELVLDGRNALVLQAYLAPFSSTSQQLSGVVVVLQDMTEQTRLDQMRRDFVANVSHELKTPLTTIISYVETLLDGALEDHTLAGAFLTTVHEEADRMNRLVKDLLMLTTLEHQQEKRKLQTVYMDEMVVEVADRMVVNAQSKGQRLLTSLPEEVPPVLANRDQIEQVLVNIVSNAIKYTQAGGEIAVSLQVQEHAVAVAVQDNGIGIPEEDLPRIFERFYRVDKARSRQLGGTGLGLSIAQQIIEGHQGRIWIESELGKGTLVTFTLPIAAAKEA
jgi:two-component system sensor histidine kinase VicK